MNKDDFKMEDPVVIYFYSDNVAAVMKVILERTTILAILKTYLSEPAYEHMTVVLTKPEYSDFLGSEFHEAYIKWQQLVFTNAKLDKTIDKLIK